MNRSTIQLLSGLALASSLMTATAYASEVNGCKVTSVRRLNVTNGVELEFRSPQGYCTYGWSSYIRTAYATDTDTNAAQITALATAALANDLSVTIGFDAANLVCDSNHVCKLNKMTFFQIKKPEN